VLGNIGCLNTLQLRALAALVREQMQADPFSGAVYVFRAKRADRVKLIYWDGTGVCLFAKRLEDGKFRWPNVQDAVMRLSERTSNQKDVAGV
jgi:transposase